MERLVGTLTLGQRFLDLEHLDEEHHDSLQQNEDTKQSTKSHYNHQVHPCIFGKGDLLLIVNIANKDNKPGHSKFVPM